MSFIFLRLCTVLLQSIETMILLKSFRWTLLSNRFKSKQGQQLYWTMSGNTIYRQRWCLMTYLSNCYIEPKELFLKRQLIFLMSYYLGLILLTLRNYKYRKRKSLHYTTIFVQRITSKKNYFCLNVRQRHFSTKTVDPHYPILEKFLMNRLRNCNRIPLVVLALLKTR